MNGCRQRLLFARQLIPREQRLHFRGTAFLIMEMENTRLKVFEHAVQCLTTERRQSTCVQPEHVKDLWLKMIAESFPPEERKRMDDVVQKWELFHDSQIQRRKPSDLKVCYLGHSHLVNDLQLLVQKGVLCRNVWVVAEDFKTKMRIWNSISQTELRNIRLYASDFLSFLKDFKGQFDIIFFILVPHLLRRTP